MTDLKLAQRQIDPIKYNRELYKMKKFKGVKGKVDTNRKPFKNRPKSKQAPPSHEGAPEIPQQAPPSHEGAPEIPHQAPPSHEGVPEVPI